MLTIFDGVLIVVLLAFMAFGFMRGFTRSLTGVLGWFLAACLTTAFLPLLYPYITHYVGSSPWIFLAVACFLFFLILLSFFMMSDWLVNFVRRSRLRFFDSGLGAFLGCAKACLLFCGAYWMILVFAPSLKEEPFLQDARVMPVLRKGTNTLRSFVHRWVEASDTSLFLQKEFGFLKASLIHIEGREHTKHSFDTMVKPQIKDEGDLKTHLL